MIIKGGQAGNVAFWSGHLQRDDTNERAEVKEIFGLLADDLPTALREMQAIADQSRSEGNFMYQANLNPEAHEHLTPEQWTQAIDILEKKMGFEGHQRVVVEHEKHGREHRHVMWNRVDVDDLKVVDISGNYKKHIEAAREIERELDLTPTPSPDLARKPDRAPELWEMRAAERSGIDPAAVKQDITTLWRSTDSGKAFAAAVNESGYILARGDRRDFCIVDHAGDAHSLARRIEDAKVKDVRERMADIDRDSLPSVADARQQQREAYPTPEAIREAWEGRKLAATPAPSLELKGTAAEQQRGDQWQEKVDTRASARAARDEKAQVNWQQRRADHIANWKDAPTREPGLCVMDAATGAVFKLGNFVDNLLSSKPTLPPEGVERIQAQRRALAAMERIAESVERGEHLMGTDVSALTPSTLENFRSKGDAGVIQMIEDMERWRAREREKERGQER